MDRHRDRGGEEPPTDQADRRPQPVQVLVGQLVRVEEIWYRVVGILEDRTVLRSTAGALRLPIRDFNQAVLVPLAAASASRRSPRSIRR